MAADNDVTRRRFLGVGGGVLLGASLSTFGTTLADAGMLHADSAALELSGGYPRTLLFRQSEVLAAELSYDEWEARMLPFDGIMGKMLAEEIPYGERHIEYFTRYKRQHPTKAVFLHFNGSGRRPSFRPQHFFAGHWLYRGGTRLTGTVAAQDTVLHVQNSSIFSAVFGRYGDRGMDICATRVHADGTPDWNQAEHMQVVAVDQQTRTVTVVRGTHGSEPLSFPSGAYVAPHEGGGPFSPPDDPQSEIGWEYNFSTECPRDKSGRNCVDALLDDLTDLLGPGGVLADIDGVEFDAFHFQYPRARLEDANGDGVIDEATFNGINTYALGRLQFADALRLRLGPDKILMADDNGVAASNRPNPNSRAFNGIETEGWRSDTEEGTLAEWSTELNLYSHWMQDGHQPRVSYLVHKVVPKAAAYPIDYAYFRGVAAAAQMRDVSVAFFIAPGEHPDWTLLDALQPLGSVPEHPPYTFDIYDELVGGTQQRGNWLGRPVHATRRLALDTPDVLQGEGVGMSQNFLNSLEGDNVTFARESGRGSPRLVVTQAGPDPRLPLDQTLEFALPGLTVSDSDLVVAVELQAEPVSGYPDSIARYVTVTLEGSGVPLQTAFVNGSQIQAVFYFRDIPPGQYPLRFVAQGRNPIALQRLTAHAAPDVSFREFEHGVVFANPSPQPYAFDLGRLLPGTRLRRLQGSPGQDPVTNDGSLVASRLNIPGNDALFTLKTEHRTP